VEFWKASVTCHSQWKHRFLSQHFYSIIHQSLDAILFELPTLSLNRPQLNKQFQTNEHSMDCQYSSEHVYKNTVSGPSIERIALYSPAVTICTASLTFNNSSFCPHSVCMCFVWIWEQTAIISLYSINWLGFRRVRKIAKTTISFVLSVRPSVCPHGTTRLPLDGFSWNFVFENF
jgi:hypothetical protein